MSGKFISRHISTTVRNFKIILCEIADQLKGDVQHCGAKTVLYKSNEFETNVTREMIIRSWTSNTND